MDFDEAITQKLDEIIADLKCSPNGVFDFFQTPVPKKGKISLKKGSCLEILPKLENDGYNAIITSPPYCNRYDYTRTYALEHALLCITEKEQVNLRQQMLSCTVESRAKELTDFNKNWAKAIFSLRLLNLLDLRWRIY